MAEESETLELRLTYKSDLRAKLAKDLRTIRSSKAVKIKFGFKPDKSVKAFAEFETRLKNLEKRGIKIPVHFELKGALKIRQEMAAMRAGIGVVPGAAPSAAAASAATATTKAVKEQIKTQQQLNDELFAAAKAREAARKAAAKPVQAPAPRIQSAARSTSTSLLDRALALRDASDAEAKAAKEKLAARQAEAKVAKDIQRTQTTPVAVRPAVAVPVPTPTPTPTPTPPPAKPTPVVKSGDQGVVIPARIVPEPGGSAAIAALRKQEPIVIPVRLDIAGAQTAVGKLRADLATLGRITPGDGAPGAGAPGGGGGGGGKVVPPSSSPPPPSSPTPGGVGRITQIATDFQRVGKELQQAGKTVTRTLSDTEKQIEKFVAKDKEPSQVRRVQSPGGAAKRQVNEFNKALRQQADVSEQAATSARVLAKEEGDLGARSSRLNKIHQERIASLKELRDKALNLQGVLRNQGRLSEASNLGTTVNNLTRKIGSENLENVRQLQAVRNKAAKQQEQTERAAAARQKQRREQDLNDQLAFIKRGGKSAQTGFDLEQRAIRSQVDSRPFSVSPIGGGPNKSETAQIQDLAQRRVGAIQDEIRSLQALRAEAAQQGNRKAVSNILDAESAARNRLAKAQATLGQSFNKSGHAINLHSRSLLRNAVTATSWLVPMSALYGTLRLLRGGFDDLLNIDRQFATLSAVFDGTAESTRNLKRELLTLGVEQGSKEALDSGVRFARLQLSSDQIGSASRDALVAQNVAEITAAKGAEFLSSVLQSYKLTLSDLPAILNRVNELSNSWNVTNKDLIAGLQRVSGIARQAGFSLQNLEGVLAASIAASGRPGAEIGNALKFIITRVRRSEVQNELKNAFDVDLTGPTGEIKSFDEILNQLASVYPTLTKGQQAYFLDLAAGSRQASRLALILENYTQAQILTGVAAGNTNSAYEENEKILASLQKRIESLSASWGKLFDTIGDAGATNLLGNVVDNLTGGISKIERGVAKVRDIIPGGTSGRVRITNKDLEAELLDFQRSRTGLIDVEGNKGIFQRIGAITNAIVPANPFKSPQVKDDTLKAFADDAERVKNLSPALKAALDFKLQAEGIEDAEISTAALVRQIKNLETESNGLAAAGNAFGQLAAQVLLPNANIEQLVETARKGAVNFKLLAKGETFDDRRSDATALEGGALDRIAGAGGSAQALARTFAQLQQELEAAEQERRQQLKDKQEAEIPKIEEQLRLLREAEAETRASIAAVGEQREALKASGEAGSEAYTKTTKDLIELSGQAKAASDAVKTLEGDLLGAKQAGKQEEPQDTFLNSLNERLELLKKFQQSAGKLVKIPTGVQATGSLVNSRVEADLNLQRKLLDQAEQQALAALTLERKRRTGESFRNGLSQQGFQLTLTPEDIAAEEKVIADFERRRQSLTQAFQGKRNRFDQDAAGVRQAAGLEATKADLNIAFDQGKLISERFAAGVSVGLTDSGKGLSRISGILDRLETPGRVTDNPLDRQRDRGQLATAYSQVQQDINSSLLRQVQIGAELENIEIRKADAARLANEERAKALTLASREEQIQAAVAARELRRRQTAGERGLSASEVAFLPQAQQRAVTQFVPQLLNNQARGLLDPTERGPRLEARALTEESQRLTRSLSGLVSRFDALDPAQLFGGAAIAEALASKFSGENLASGGSVEQNPPTFDINLGDVQVNLNEQFTAAVAAIAGDLRTQVSAELAAIRAEVNRVNPATAVTSSVGGL